MRGYAAETVDEYLAAVPEDQRGALRAVREFIVAAIPGVEEGIGYGIAIFKYRGHGLVGLSAAQKHCSLHLMSPGVALDLKDELTEGWLSGATLQFGADAPLSEATVRLIVERRIAEADGRLG